VAPVTGSDTKDRGRPTLAAVIAGLDPAIHLFEIKIILSDGYAGQARV
jgi:hypothetical protein